ncbi:unnamed protein product [Adineta steineri]|uniref:G-protein coupled receptors family 1 profile domain-containing protein n=1 Tax=Adineta steineri TaxID=433720 RepID=A0A814RMW0_9BILA|nr:unnamed protein product [Adineta steineri]CAF4005812.1 unnamed protein product [Adineta steineri]
MNSSTQYITNLIIDYSIIGFSSTGILISISMLTFILYHIIKNKIKSIRIALLLTGNMYFALLLFFTLIIDTYTYTLEGHIYGNIFTNNTKLCRVRAYFVTTVICALFYSNTLQAIYRFCRIIFYMKKKFQSFQIHIIIIVIQWIICFIVTSPALFLNRFEYLPDDYHCQIPYGNFQTIILYGIIIYIIPLTITIGCYIFTLRKMHNENNRFRQIITQIQRFIIQREMNILFRLCILLGFMITFFIPSTIIFLINQFTGYLPWWSSQIRWLSYVLSMICVTIILAFISPHIRNLWINSTGFRKLFPKNKIAPAVIKIN